MMLRDYSSLKNLKLAWERLKRTSDRLYKAYYREIFISYEININTILKRIRNNFDEDYIPNETIKEFWVKPSGLRRTITVLHPEDYIIYQAFANILAQKHYLAFSAKYRKKRFANQPQADPGSDFFLVDWRTSADFNRFLSNAVRAHEAG